MTFDATVTALTDLFNGVLTDSVDVIRNTPGADDKYGNPAEVWALDHAEPAWVKHTVDDADRDGVDKQFRAKTVFLAATADVLDDDRIDYLGLRYHIRVVVTIKGGSVASRKKLVIERLD